MVVDRAKWRAKIVKKYGKRAVGKRQLIRYLSGEKISRTEAIKAKCYDCMGYCADGISECKDKDCPLWAYSQFRRKEASNGKADMEAKEEVT
ncbi:MAG: hypothetical protein DRG27_06255 [Deltaproteobacteria bacterium]|nr:MAG: hypothetical protein DRG27_06255 [Deltaproteobacteria bacterium]